MNGPTKLAIAVTCLLGAAPKTLPAEDDAASEAPSKIYVRMTTTLGDLLIELDREKAPNTVDNFLTYVDSGFYEGTMFHRIIKNFMVQGGGMTEGYKKKETRDPVNNEADNGLLNKKNTIAMARTGDPNSATSQFFFNTKYNSALDHSGKKRSEWGYCVFGKVVGDLSTLNAIEDTPVHKDPRADRRSTAAADTPVLIKKVVRVDPADIADIVAAARKAEAEESARAAADEAEASTPPTASADPMEQGKTFVASKGVDISKGHTSESGLWYVDVTEGTGESPATSNLVTVHYTGWLTDGTKFDSSVDRGKPSAFGLNRVIGGWTEGVGGMKEGGKRFLVIPPEMAYGTRARPKIPANSTLVFEIELISFIK